jgi:hypothetical protein
MIQFNDLEIQMHSDKAVLPEETADHNKDSAEIEMEEETLTETDRAGIKTKISVTDTEVDLIHPIHN